MRTGTVSYKLEDLKKGVIIPIGFVGENDFTKVFFDAEEIYKKYPSASVSMKVQPPKGGIYPATVTRDGNTVIWQVKEADVANRGGGELQLTFIDGETKIKTYIAKTDVKRSLAGNGPAPDPVQDWIDDAEDVLENVEAAEIHQPMIGLDGYWYTWNQETGEYEKTNTKAQGADGHSPVLTSSKSGKTTTLYADGEKIAQIQDGEDGQGADVIDDTAGEGDTDKTWSADKLTDEFGDVLTAIDGIGDFVGDTDTDLGTHEESGVVDLTNMTPATDTLGNVNLTITKTHITASGLCNSTSIKNLQEITVPAGDYEFSTGSIITAPGFQLQVYNVTDDVVICSLASSATSEKYPFTLSAQKKLRIRVMVVSGKTINESNEIYLHQGGSVSVPNTLAYATKDLIDFASPSTDLGSHQKNEVTDYTNMTARSVTDGNVQLTITKTHITAYGTCDTTTLRNLQENIIAPAGDYEFDIGTNIASSGYQLQIYNHTDSTVIKALSNAQGSGSVAKFTLTAEKNLRIRSLVTANNAIDESNEVHLRRIDNSTQVNTLAYLALKHDAKFLQGKKILVFGDSIWGDDRTEGIADYLAEYSGATIYNAGIGGTRITGDRAQYEVPKFIPYDGVTLINAFLTNTWTDQDAGASEVWDYVSSATLPMLKSLNIQDIDIVILAYGTNDFSSNKSISDVSGAFLSAISALLTENPKLRILCIVPPWRMFESGTVDGDIYENGNSDTLQEFDAGIESAIKAKHTEVLNMFERCPWRAETKGYYMDQDAIHPNSKGNQVYAHIVNGKLKTMY